MYEISFPKLSERYFKNGPWPAVDLVSDLVDQDHVFCLLYKVCVGGEGPWGAGGLGRRAAGMQLRLGGA